MPEDKPNLPRCSVCKAKPLILYREDGRIYCESCKNKLAWSKKERKENEERPVS